MKNLRQFESLTIFDMEMFAVAILFHTENQENMPTINAYRSFLLKTLKSKMDTEYDVIEIFYQFLKDSVLFSKIEDINANIQKAIYGIKNDLLNAL